LATPNEKSKKGLNSGEKKLKRRGPKQGVKIRTTLKVSGKKREKKKARRENGTHCQMGYERHTMERKESPNGSRLKTPRSKKRKKKTLDHGWGREQKPENKKTNLLLTHNTSPPELGKPPH